MGAWYQNKHLLLPKKAVFISLFAIMLTFLGTQNAFAFSGDGAGINLDPYIITTCVQLQEMDQDLDADYELGNDIDCSGDSFTSVGTVGTPFQGSLDGTGHTISNLDIDGTDEIGLFGYTSGANFESFRITNSSVTGNSAVGMLAGNLAGGSITDVTADNNTLSVTTGGAGGLIAISSGVLDMNNSSSTNSSLNAGTGQAYVGGLIARIQGDNTINNSYATGTINGTNLSYAGGLVGAVLSGSPVISRTYSSMEFSSSGTYNGGLIGGFFGGTISDSFSASSMPSGGTLPGGAFGVGDGTSTNNYFDSALANRSNCSGSGSADCSAENPGNSSPDYFTSDLVNPPMDGWVDGDPWNLHEGDELPSFAIGSAMCDDPPQTDSTIAFRCEFQREMKHQYSGELVSKQIRYREQGTGEWTYQDWANDTDLILITGLDSTTTYEIHLHAEWEVGASDWTLNTLDLDTVDSPGPDTDGDGVRDSEELSGPNYGDSNDDSTLDSEQANVITYVNSKTEEYAVLETDCNSIDGFGVNGESASQPDSGYSYPMGLTSFEITCDNPGDTARVRQYYYGIEGSDEYSVRKFKNDGTYKEIPGYEPLGALIDGEVIFLVEYDITDGEEFDDDGDANAVIVDPSGPALVDDGSATLANTGSSASDISTVALTIMFFAIAIGIGANQKINFKIK
jgi:hypothetical protein